MKMADEIDDLKSQRGLWMFFAISFFIIIVVFSLIYRSGEPYRVLGEKIADKICNDVGGSSEGVVFDEEDFIIVTCKKLNITENKRYGIRIIT